MPFILTISIDDTDKIDALFRKYEKPLYFYIYSIVKDWHLSEDVLQTVFYKIIKNIDKIKAVDSSPTKNYIYTIAKNTAIDYYHAKKKEDSASLPYDDEVLMQMDEWEAKEIIAMANRNLLEDCLTELSDSDREIILLKYEMGWTDAQIAEILEISSDAARQRLSRAKKRLALILQGRKEDLS